MNDVYDLFMPSHFHARTNTETEWDDTPYLRPAWHDFALCKGQTDRFFAPLDEDRNELRRQHRRRIGHDHYIAARQLCKQCPVQEPCRTFAREGEVRFGCWGGESPQDRIVTKPRKAA